MKETSLLLADDHVLVLDSMAQILKEDFDVVGVVQNGRAMVTKAREFRPDVVVTDISMPELNGIDATRILKKEICSLRFVFLTMHSDIALVEQAFRAGASGYVLKTCGADELRQAIKVVARGATYITPLVSADLVSTLVMVHPPAKARASSLTGRQREVLQLLAEGKTMKQAAAELLISTRTAESHKYEIMRQLGVRTTAELIRHAVEIKLV